MAYANMNRSISVDNQESPQEHTRLLAVLQECYDEAEKACQKEDTSELTSFIGEDNAKVITELATAKHACRGAAITLAIYKVLHPTQDIRNHKSEHENGFSARQIDTNTTVPFLQNNGLPYNVETHWLSQTLSFSGPYVSGLEMKTTPKKVGPSFIHTVNLIESAGANAEFIKKILVLILKKMVEERNKGKIPLTKPKHLSIDEVMCLLHQHFSCHYEKNSPRLPQVAIYAIYKCLKNDIDRYSEFELMPLERMKAANRKSGTVGDIDLWKDGRPIEAVEIKFEIPINHSHVNEAMQKVLTKSVERYFILSTAVPDPEEYDEIERLKKDFLHTNGCEIIVNGVYDTIKYYLRLLKSTNDFINTYTDILACDPDINYEHKIAWNNICKTR